MSSIEVCLSSSKSHSTFDFEGLEESLVDNNEEDDDDDDFLESGGLGDSSIPMGAADSSGIIFDHNLIMIRDALIRDSSTRTEEDFEIIVRFLSIINSNHDHMTRRRLAPHFVLAEIEARDTRVLTHGEKLDAYCIVAAGSLRHVLPCEEDGFAQEAVGSSVDDDSHSSVDAQISSGCSSAHHHHHHQNVRYLQVGDEFGAHLDDRVVYGEIFTNDSFVWVLCVPHVIFDQICGEKTFKTIRDEVTGNIIEMRANSYIPLPSGSTSAHSGSVSAPDEGSANEFSIHQQANIHGFKSDDFSSHSSQSILNVQSQSNKTSLPSNQTGKSGVVSTVSPSINKQISLIANDSNELIRATKERLYELVFSPKSSETFIEDFLLTFRIWSEKELNANRDVVIMRDLMNRLCSHIRTNQNVENCVRIVLIWMANHFQDFQNDNRFLLEDFENILKERTLTDHLRLFHLNLSAKSTERSVTVTRSDRKSTLPFNLIGGYECSARLFIGEVFNVQIVPSLSSNSSINSSSLTSMNYSSTSLTSNSSTGQSINPQNIHTLGLRPGDRVVSINGVDCHVMPIKRAYDLCMASTHLSLLVKYDPHLYNAFMEGRCETKRQIVETYSLNNRMSTGSISISGLGQGSNQNSCSGVTPTKDQSKKDSNSTGNIWRQKMRSLVSMTTKELISSTSNILHNNNNHHSNNNLISVNNEKSNSGQQLLNNGQILISGSNSSISSGSSGVMNSSGQNSTSSGSSSHPRVCSYEVPEIIKIYFYENNDFRFLPINSATTARECIQLSLREFNLSSSYSSIDFALYKYSVMLGTNNASGATEDNNSVANLVKRLSDGTNDLVTHLGLNARFYLKLANPNRDGNSNNSNNLSESDIFKDIVKESSIVSLLNLDGSSIARELTARDFRLFCKIEAQQFVYDLAFNDPNRSNSTSGSLQQESGIIFERTKELQEFERKTNEEMFWTINQVLSEKRSLSKRVKVIKQLIRIANIAMKLNNFNTLFAILSGLTHLSVSRLKNCWDKVPNKVIKKLHKLQMLMDPSRNFYNFRQKLMEILRQDNGAYIIIPFFPLVKKDLSFIWLANQTYINSAEQSSSSENGTKTQSQPKTKGEMLVNWEKMRLLSEKIREIQKMTNTTSLALAAVNGLNQSTGGNIATPSAANEPIDPNLLFRIFADSMTGEDPRTFSNKRLWESQIMTKRVQSFLDDSFGSITSDEHILLTRSYSCEIPHTPNSSLAATRSSIASTMSSNSQLSHPSPTPSTASSSSNSLSMNSDGPGGHLLHRPHRPRFGQTSPKQLRKLLALSDGAVAVHKEHSRTESSLTSHHSSHHRNGHNNSQSTHAYHQHQHHHGSNSGSALAAGSSTISTSQSRNHNFLSGQHQQQTQYSQTHSFHSSNSSLNSSLSGSTSYYNNLYGAHPNSQSSQGNPSTTTSSSPSVGPYHVSNINGSMTLPPTYMHSGSMSMNKLSRNYSQSNVPFNPAHYNELCCPTKSNNQCCSAGPQNGVLYPGQSYCSCCPQPSGTPTMRAPMMMMPPPQQSGLMHPSCPCGPSSTQGTRGPRHFSSQGSTSQTGSLKQSLPVESSSVTSLRRLEQYQQIARYREVRTSNTKSNSRRPQCPDYDTAMQRICTGSSTITINGNALNHNGSGLLGSNKGSQIRPTPVPPIPPPPTTSKSHHREDIV